VIRSFRNSLLILPLLLASVVPSAVHAIEAQDSAISWKTQSDDFADRGFSSGFGLFYAGPEWFLNALSNPRSRNPFVKSFLDDSAGDRLGAENGYVGPLRDVFDPGLFSNMSLFAGSTGGKTSFSTPLAIVGNDYYWHVNGSADGLGGTGTWDIGVTANWNDSSGMGTPDFWTNGKNAFFQGTAGTVTLISGLSANAWNVTVGGYTFTGGDLTVGAGNIAISNNSGTTTVDSVIIGTAGLTKTGAGNLVLNGANTYTGGTTINAGTITAGNTTALGNGPLTFDNGSTGRFQLNGFNVSITDLRFSQTNTGTPIVENGAATPAILMLNPTSTYAFAGILQDGSTGSLGLTLNGEGLVLYNANTYTGDTTINAGTLTFNSATFPNYSGSADNSTIRLGSTATNSAAAILALGGNPPNTISSPLIVQASGGTEGQRLFINTATTGLNTYSGVSVTMNTGLTLQSVTGGQFLLNNGTINFGTSTLSVNANAGANVDNVNLWGTVRIADTMASNSATGGSIVKDGSAILIIESTGNTYTGNTAAGVAANGNGTRIGGGILGIYGDTSLGLAPSTATNNVFFTTSAQGSTTAPTLQDTSGNVNLAATRNINIASGVTARFDSNGNTFTIAGVINGNGGNLNKIGGGILVLTGANTYTGTTTVSAGTLIAAAPNALGGTTGNITVNRGGTLLVSGDGNLDRINNNTPIVLGSASGSGIATFQRGDPVTGTVVSEGSGASRNGAIVTGTSSAGLGALSLQSSATFDFGTVGAGTFTFGSFTANTNTLTILNWTSGASALTQTSGVDGTDDRLIFSGVPDANLAFINFNGTPAAAILLDTGFYEVVPVPETSTWVTGALALAAIGFTQRRRICRLLERRA
jgi:autotransporter-associated beta strand protein